MSTKHYDLASAGLPRRAALSLPCGPHAVAQDEQLVALRPVARQALGHGRGQPDRDLEKAN